MVMELQDAVEEGQVDVNVEGLVDATVATKSKNHTQKSCHIDHIT